MKIVIKNKRVGYEKDGEWIPLNPDGTNLPPEWYRFSKEVKRSCRGTKDHKNITWKSSQEGLSLEKTSKKE